MICSMSGSFTGGNVSKWRRESSCGWVQLMTRCSESCAGTGWVTRCQIVSGETCWPFSRCKGSGPTGKQLLADARTLGLHDLVERALGEDATAPALGSDAEDG